MTALGQQLIDNVRRIAGQDPDHVYNPGRDEETGRYAACQYVRNGCGDCLIGRALWEAGVIGADLEQTSRNKEPFLALLDALELDLDYDERRWLIHVQKYQDNFRPWGIAVQWTDEKRYEHPTAGFTWNAA